MDIKVDKNTVIVFDLDDTLYNELDYLKSAYVSIAQYLEKNDWKPLYSKMFSLYRSNLNVFEVLAEDYTTDIKVLIELYRNHIPNINLFDGVLGILTAIKSKNGNIAIVTDGRIKTQNTKIKSLGILNLIDKIVISEEIGSEKPHLANFQAIEKGILGKQYYYIADNLKKDFISPNTLGWGTIGLIDNGKNIHFESHKYMGNDHKPQEFILSFKEIKII